MTQVVRYVTKEAGMNETKSYSRVCARISCMHVNQCALSRMICVTKYVHEICVKELKRMPVNGGGGE